MNMEFPDGFKYPKPPDLVFKLLKSQYGLKQAPRQRYANIHKFLVYEKGFNRSHSDPRM